MATSNSFGSRATFKVGKRSFEIFSLPAVEKAGLRVSRLPYSLRILLEALLRYEDGTMVTRADIEALAHWAPAEEPSREIDFTPARVLMQDFTGVPAVVDLAAMRDAMARMGGDPARINPLQPAELVIDHSVQVDEFGTRIAFRTNVEREYERNRERYAFLRWGQQSFRDFKVVPPGTGIVHQVNLEYLARVVFDTDVNGTRQAYPDTLVGTDSHTTMINGLGVLGWGVGGIEAEAAMLGQPVSMLIPQVVGFRMVGELAEGTTATDLVLRVTEVLRKKGVVGKFVEFFGPGLGSLQLADRATIANMAPEYGATCGIFPVDDITLRYLAFTGRPADQVELVGAYMKEQGLFRTKDTPDPEYSDVLELDLSTVEPSLAGPRRPQDRIPLSNVKNAFFDSLEMMLEATGPKVSRIDVGRWQAEGGDVGTAMAPAHTKANGVPCVIEGERVTLHHGSVVIAAITSCTNTSNPSVMVAAGLVAKKAVEKGLKRKPWVKTSLAPGSKVVTDYLDDAKLTSHLEALDFHLVGYGCTTCIGNSGPLPAPVSEAIEKGNLVACSVLSGNRNFEGRIQGEVRANYLASPPLVVAYALAGRIDIDLYNEPLGEDAEGRSVFLKDIWPSPAEIEEVVTTSVRPEMFQKQYAEVYTGDDQWAALPVPQSELYQWNESSTYIKNPPYFENMSKAPPAIEDIEDARVLALVGDSITTDHISPAGAFKPDTPAGKYLIERGVQQRDFNSYGSRRGNHEVMMRGTFANVRLRNQLCPGVEGGFTTLLPDGAVMPIFDAAMKYAEQGRNLIVIAGKEYGSGSSRDWAAKGPRLLGVRAVIAESYERIHRSNLIGMGVLPLQFVPGENAESLGLDGRETFAIRGLADTLERESAGRRTVTVRATRPDGASFEFSANVRADTPQEIEYYRHGGILHYVLRQLLSKG
ncbi:MAG: aconitate hydratase AcnA [Longimicrobiales bacterium]